MLPGMSGIEVCEQLRRRETTSPCSCSPPAAPSPNESPASRRAPTTTSSSRSRSRSTARLRAIRRRIDPDADRRLVFGDVTLDPLNSACRSPAARSPCPAASSRCSPRCWRTAATSSAGQALRRRVGGRGHPQQLHRRTHLRLRNHLESRQVTIKTLRGVGYGRADRTMKAGRPLAHPAGGQNAGRDIPHHPANDLRTTPRTSTRTTPVGRHGGRVTARSSRAWGVSSATGPSSPGSSWPSPGPWPSCCSSPAPSCSGGSSTP